MLTPSQLHILQHSLGVDQYGQGNQYRNHYVTGPECDVWNNISFSEFLKDVWPHRNSYQ